MLKNLIDFIGKLIDKSGIISSLLIILLILLVSTSVILRYAFSIGFVWLQDLYIWIHAIFILLGISFTFKLDEHVRIDVYYRILKNKIKNKINFLGSIFFGIPLSLIIILNGYDYFSRSLFLNESSKETGGLPNIFILKFFILLMGIFLFLEILRQILNFLRNK